jgi:hypothetical protein
VLARTDDGWTNALRDDYLKFVRPLSELDKYFVDHWGEVSDYSSWTDGTL